MSKITRNSPEGHALCNVCGKVPPNRWVALARYVVAGDHEALWKGCVNDDDEEEWDPDSAVAAIDIACWPDCFYLFIEAKMVEADMGAVK